MRTEKVRIGKEMICRLLAAAAAAVLAFCVAVTACRWNEVRKAQEKERYYQQKEEELKKTVREYLNDNGYPNSGIMLTRIVCEDGSRRYTLTVHHDRIDGMGEDKRRELSQELESLCFAEEKCTFQSEFLLQQICRN